MGVSRFSIILVGTLIGQIVTAISSVVGIVSGRCGPEVQAVVGAEEVQTREGEVFGTVLACQREFMLGLHYRTAVVLHVIDITFPQFVKQVEGLACIANLNASRAKLFKHLLEGHILTKPVLISCITIVIKIKRRLICNAVKDSRCLLACLALAQEEEAVQATVAVKDGTGF